MFSFQSTIERAVKKLIVIAVLLNPVILANAQTVNAPTGLMIDLIGGAGYRSVNFSTWDSLKAGIDAKNEKIPRIANKQPVFSWEVDDQNNFARQTAYQLLIADSPTLLAKNIGNIANTGKVYTALSAGVTIQNIKIKPNTAYFWKVRVWNQRNYKSPFSLIHTFFTDSVLADHQTPAYPLQTVEEHPLKNENRKGFCLADFGRDAFGQLKLSLFSATGTDSVIIRLGEALDTSGRINRKPGGSIYYGEYGLLLQKGWHNYKINLRSNAYNTRPEAIKMPSYIGEVAPFRYCEIVNYKLQLKAADITRLSVFYHFNDAAANFHCSDDALNRVWDLCKYSIKATSFLGMYVDGNRERTPYEADALINQLSHYAVDKEFTLARRSHEYLVTHPTWPTEWILQSVLIAWNDYLYTGDISSAKFYYQDLKAKTLGALADDTHLISTRNGKMSPAVLQAVHFAGGPLKDIVDWPRPSETDDFVFCKYNAVVNAFYYRALIIMQKLATDLGQTADSRLFGQKAKAVKEAYQVMFYDRGRKIYVDGDSTRHASLHANAFALALGLVDKGKEQPVLNYIISRGMACSVYGSQFLLEGLYDAGGAEHGLSLMINNGERGWLHMLDQGSTITTEAWDGRFKPNQDWNHAWGTAPANIISRKLMGITPLTPGWDTFQIKPQIAWLSYAAIDVPTIKGTIKVQYSQTGETFTISARVPANTMATVYLPVKGKKKLIVSVDGREVSIKNKQGTFVTDIGSGKHLIRIRYIA